ncbi:hypothetical protein QYF36_015140 [Acer negundo]|nr:hypothetical protein QYF36_015140 [Acer negundo]
MLQEKENGRFPSQPEQARAMSILRSERVLGDSNKEVTIEEEERVQAEGKDDKELEKEDEVEVKVVSSSCLGLGLGLARLSIFSVVVVGSWLSWSSSDVGHRLIWVVRTLFFLCGFKN